MPPSILGIEVLLDRKPKALSGGQRQRVAVGRAIVRQPKVFLFDEPLSNLDAKMRVQMRTEITKLHQRLQATMIYVTHDQIEAMTMGDRIVVMNDGSRAAKRRAAHPLQQAGQSFRGRLSRQSADEFHLRHTESRTATRSDLPKSKAEQSRCVCRDGATAAREFIGQRNDPWDPPGRYWRSRTFSAKKAKAAARFSGDRGHRRADGRRDESLPANRRAHRWFVAARAHSITVRPGAGCNSK